MKKTGGNGGYKYKSKPKEAPGPKRAFNLRDYHGKKIKKGG